MFGTTSATSTITANTLTIGCASSITVVYSAVLDITGDAYVGWKAAVSSDEQGYGPASGTSPGTTIRSTSGR